MIEFYFAPFSRAAGVFWLLEELGQPYTLHHVDIRARGGVPEAYRAIQPNKKVPAIVHDGVIVTERAAISLYLADTFPQRRLAPAISDYAARARYLTWLVYSDSVFDPVVAGKVHNLSYGSNDYAFGLFDDMVANLIRTLSSREYIAGDAFTAADTQIASGIHFAANILKVLPAEPCFVAYLGRVRARPAYKSYVEKEMEEARKHGLPLRM